MARATKPAAPEERNEISYCKKDGTPHFLIVSINNRDVFILYDISGAKRKKIGQSDNPLELEEKYDIMSKLS